MRNDSVFCRKNLCQGKNMKQGSNFRRWGLVQLRKRLGLPQVQLASALGLDQSAFCRWERGQRRLPSEVVDKIEEYLSDRLLTLKSLPAHSYPLPLAALSPQARQRMN